MRHLLIMLVVAGMAAITAAVVLRIEEQSRDPHAAHAAICNQKVPMGAIAPAVPEWCAAPLTNGLDTHHASGNAWVDDFNHGQTHAKMSSAYVTGEANGGGCDVIHFQHNNHWMADIQGDNGQYPTLCAAVMRPNRTFTPGPDGRLVIEFEVASPIAGTRNVNGLSDAWPEFTVTQDPSPGNLRANGTYIYETFAGHWTFGCRMQQAKHPICSLYSPQDGPPARPQRVFEINQNGGDVASDKNGGTHAGTGNAIDKAWVGCTSTQDPDTICRNKHRVEITADSIKFWVNGVEGYSAVFMNDEMDKLLSKPVYVYFGDFAYRIEQDAVVRFHWDRLAINPQLLSGAQAPTSTPTSVPSATVTASPTKTASPGPTKTASPAPTSAPSTPTPTTGPPKETDTWTTTATASPESVRLGTTERINVSVTSGMTRSALVDIEVYASDGRKVHQVHYDAQSFRAGVAKQYSVSWNVPKSMPAGTYTVKVGIFKPGWGSLYHWNNGADTFKVVR